MANFDTFLESLAGLENDIYSTEFDITKLMLPDKEAVKKLIGMKNPGFTKDQIDMMIDSEEELIKKKEELEEKRAESREKSSLSREEKAKVKEEEKAKRKKQREEEKERRKKELKERIRAYKEVYKEKVKQIIKEAKNVKQEIKEATFQLITKLKDMAKKIIMSVIQTASSIPAIIITISAPPWNVPKAISYVLIIVESYLNIIKSIKEVLPFLKPLKNLPLVTGKNNLKKVGAFLNVIVKAIRALWIPIKLLDTVIKALIKAITSFLSRNKNKIFRKATKKLKKLGHLYKPSLIKWLSENDKSFPGIPSPSDLLRDPPPPFVRGKYRQSDEDGNILDIPCYAYEDDDIDEVQDLLRTYVIGDENKITNRVVAYKKNKESDDPREKTVDEMLDDLDKLDAQLDDSVDNFPDIERLPDSGEEDRFIYDILLPDGTVFKNISEEGVEEFKNIYSTLTFIDFSTQSSLTQSTDGFTLLT
jgi:hypothetical protein